MKIVVLVKHTPESTATWQFTDELTVDRDGVEGRLSELDEYPVEQAVRLAEAGAAAEISYLTMGPPRAAEALRKALAMGGDRGFHVTDAALRGSDALATSLVLAEAVRRIGFDLLLTGMASTDGEMAVLPVMLAERLGIPVLANADALTVRDGAVRVRRDAAEATEEFDAPLPALVSVTDRSGDVRYPAFRSIVASKKKPITTWSLADLEIPAHLVGVDGSATLVRGVRPRPPRVSGTVIVDEGDAAVRIADFLAANHLI